MLILLQVSHHPPISAAHAENDKWVYDIVSAPSTKFMGNSVEIYPVGVHLKSSGFVSFSGLRADACLNTL